MAVIFLMVVGSLFIYTMSNLSSVSSATQSIALSGDVTLAVARSGLQFGVYVREQKQPLTTALTGAELTYPSSSGITPTPCSITVSESAPASCAVSCVYTVSSLATCYSGTAQLANRRVAMRVRGTKNTAPTPDSYQAVPGSIVTVTVDPNYGAAAGGTSVTILGIGFTGATAATFGGTAGTGLTVNSDTSITITTAAHAAGLVDVAITTPEGTITFPSAFTYQ